MEEIEQKSSTHNEHSRDRSRRPNDSKPRAPEIQITLQEHFSVAESDTRTRFNLLYSIRPNSKRCIISFMDTH